MFNFCIQLSCPSIILDIESLKSEINTVINSIFITFDNQQKHKQLKLITSGVYCSYEKGVLFTTDGRGCLPSIDNTQNQRNNENIKNVRGIEIIWTQARLTNVCKQIF